MNKRFDELRLDAGIAKTDGVSLVVVNAAGNVIDPMIGLTQFAESIVQECMGISLKNSHRDDDMGAIIAKHIKQHFGI